MTTSAKSQGPVVIEAEHYQLTRNALAADPIIQALEAELPDDLDIDGWSFTTAALREYHARGGTVQTHIGGPAEAIRILRTARKDRGLR